MPAENPGFSLANQIIAKPALIGTGGASYKNVPPLFVVGGGSAPEGGERPAQKFPRQPIAPNACLLLLEEKTSRAKNPGFSLANQIIAKPIPTNIGTKISIQIKG